MKLKNIFLLLFILGFTAVNAQRITKGDKIINLGIGLIPAYYSGVGYSSTTPPLSASFEYIVNDEVADLKGAWGIGAYIGYGAYKWQFVHPNYGTWGYKSSNLFIGPRGTFHYEFIRELDVYGGLFLGYDIVKTKEFGTIYPGYTYTAKSSTFVWSLYAGGHYFFSEKISAMLELGYGISYMNLGVAFKL